MKTSGAKNIQNQTLPNDSVINEDLPSAIYLQSPAFFASRRLKGLNKCSCVLLSPSCQEFKRARNNLVKQDRYWKRRKALGRRNR